MSAVKKWLEASNIQHLQLVFGQIHSCCFSTCSLFCIAWLWPTGNQRRRLCSSLQLPRKEASMKLGNVLTISFLELLCCLGFQTIMKQRA